MGGAGIDLAALAVLFFSEDDHWTRFAIGTMIFVSTVGFAGAAFAVMGATRAHFDASIMRMVGEHASTHERLGVLERSDDDRYAEAFELGLKQRLEVDSAARHAHNP